MKVKFESNINKNLLFRLRIDSQDSDRLLNFLRSEKVGGSLITAETASVTGKLHLHSVFESTKKVTAIRTAFKKYYPELTGANYSFSQNWSQATKSKDMKLYMQENNLEYKDIHIIYILKDSNIKYNDLVLNPEALNFATILKTIGHKPKNKKYGNYTKKLIMEYNTLYPTPLIDNSDERDDFPERERIFKFVTSSLSATNLDLFVSNAKCFDTWTIKKLCQTVLNTRKFSKDFYPNENYSSEVNSYFF